MDKSDLAVKDYFKTVNLDKYDLGGCEFTDDDFRTIAVRWICSNRSLEIIVHEYLLELRDFWRTCIENRK